MRMSEEQFLQQTFRALKKFSMGNKLPVHETSLLPLNHDLCRTHDISPAFELVITNLIENRGFKRGDAIAAGKEAINYFRALENGHTLPEPTSDLRSIAISMTEVIGGNYK